MLTPVHDKKLFLLDAMAVIYRAYFAFANNHRYNSNGLNTSAMFGFTNTLLEVLQKEKPTHIAVVFDTAAPTARHEEFEAYKAHREEMPEDLSLSIPWIIKIIEALLFFLINLFLILMNFLFPKITKLNRITKSTQIKRLVKRLF